MNPESKILITGATGMVGGALARYLQNAGFRQVLTPSRHELDLLNADNVERYFACTKPQFVFLIAAKVGGIAANMADPVGYLAENLTTAINALAACHRHSIEKTLLLGSSCIYPRDCLQPIREEYLLTGPLEPTNEGYALAKISALKLAAYYHRQYGMRIVCPMPCNIYGTGDHFDLQRSHVLSALVRRFCDAYDSQSTSVTLWGTGSARREFVHVDDVITGMLFLMRCVETPEIVNLGTGVDISIRDLALQIASYVGYTGRIEWDTSKPDGMPRKCMDCSRLHALGFRPQIDLETGIRRTIAEFCDLKAQGKIPT